MKKIKQCCVNCHYACLQFKNLVLLPDGSPKYNFSKDWDFSIEDPLMCFYPIVNFPYRFKTVDDNFVCDCFLLDKQRESDIKAGC